MRPPCMMPHRRPVARALRSLRRSERPPIASAASVLALSTRARRASNPSSHQRPASSIQPFPAERPPCVNASTRRDRGSRCDVAGRRSRRAPALHDAASPAGGASTPVLAAEREAPDRERSERVRALHPRPPCVEPEQPAATGELNPAVPRRASAVRQREHAPRACSRSPPAPAVRRTRAARSDRRAQSSRSPPSVRRASTRARAAIGGLDAT